MLDHDVCHFPTNVVASIYTVLDYKSIIRCSCVSKQWLNILNDDQFWSRRFQIDFGGHRKTPPTRQDYNLEFQTRYGLPQKSSFWLDDHRVWRMYSSYALGVGPNNVVGVDLRTMKGVDRIDDQGNESYGSVAAFERVVFTRDMHDGFYSFWDLELGVEIGPRVWDCSRCVSCDGDVMVHNSNKAIRVWTMLDQQRRCELHGHQERIKWIQVKGRKFLTGSKDHTMKLWDLSKEICEKTLPHESTVTCVALNQMQMYSGCSQGLFKVWDARTGSLVSEFQCYNSEFFFDVDDTKIVSNDLQYIRVWDLRTLKCVREIPIRHPDNHDFMHYDGCCIYTGKRNGYIDKWRFD